jgi:ABC-type uncharacterized transport system ATPase subunit
MKVIIQKETLSKYYSKKNQIIAVNNLNLKVYEGETFGLLGPNGIIKTTARAVGTIKEIIAQTKTKTLEEAFIALTGGVEEKELIAWRKQ